MRGPRVLGLVLQRDVPVLVFVIRTGPGSRLVPEPAAGRHEQVAEHALEVRQTYFIKI